MSTGAGKTFSLPERVLSDEEGGAASLGGEALGVVGFEDFDVCSFLGLWRMWRRFDGRSRSSFMLDDISPRKPNDIP
jgi:hypothetical protein